MKNSPPRIITTANPAPPFDVSYSGFTVAFEAIGKSAGGKQAKANHPKNLINELRRELWALAIRPEILIDFMSHAHRPTKSVKSTPDLCRSLFAMTA